MEHHREGKQHRGVRGGEGVLEEEGKLEEEGGGIWGGGLEGGGGLKEEGGGVPVPFSPSVSLKNNMLLIWSVSEPKLEYSSALIQNSKTSVQKSPKHSSSYLFF